MEPEVSRTTSGPRGRVGTGRIWLVQKEVSTKFHWSSLFPVDTLTLGPLPLFDYHPNGWTGFIPLLFGLGSCDRPKDLSGPLSGLGSILWSLFSVHFSRRIFCPKYHFRLETFTHIQLLIHTHLDVDIGIPGSTRFVTFNIPCQTVF